MPFLGWKEHFGDHERSESAEKGDLLYLPLPEGTNSNLPSGCR
jgi:hypothetical protein